ncbi:MIP/aquaporin family protein [Nocardioides marmorisolisilvae]|uniref:Porin n=1 Tax=Nocardioides marmorisolisilvae TaxID=1542737 RepID=A0A3N0DSE7_9ACTN|nr:aquaporin [Nocardioides marmorisolisilvae]RNL78550.1 porin [Nocardioides marmorisolisilvae]
MSDSARKYVTELIGTFFLVFTVISAVSTKAELAPLGIGAVLMVMIFAGGHISGAHYNPAVSIAAFVRGRLDSSDLAPYIVSQLIGSTLAALLGLWMFDNTAPDKWTGKPLGMALVVEILFTFALAYVVLNVATSKDHPDNSFYGLAIGFTVAAGAVAVGAISGAAFNPAVAFGVSLTQLSPWANIWVYWLAQVIGGILAGVTFKALNPSDA